MHETLSVYDYSYNKICDLYDSNVELFGQAYDIDVTKEWDGTHSLSFRIPYIIDDESFGNDLSGARYGIAIFGTDKFGVAIRNMGNKNFRWMFLKSDYMIRYTCGDKKIWFVANKPKKLKDSKGIYGDVSCSGAEILLKTRNIYMSFDDENGIGTIAYLMGQILKGTGWTYDSTGSDTLVERDGVTEKVRSLKDDGKKGALDLIITTCNLFQARPIFDTDAKKVTIKSINNRQQVLEGEVGRNLTALSVLPDSTDIVTRLYVEGEYGDYGYVGIDDVEVNGEPYGLPFIVNFDYYRNLGVFTQDHETALATYLASIKAKKAQIRANGSLLIQADDAINTMIGQCKLAVYYKNDSLTTPKYTYGDIMSIEAALNVGDNVYILLNNGKYTQAAWSGVSQLTEAYGVAKFATPSAGKIGAAEVQVESKEKEIELLRRKIETASSDEKIAEYEAEIERINGEIDDLYNDAENGLYVMMNSVMNSTGLLYQHSQHYEANIDLNEEQDDIEATFIAAMGYMLRDGYWNNKNYTVGQEEYLYADAVDMAEQMGKPKATYTFSYVRVEEEYGVPAEDIEINAIFKIYDKELDIDDKMFIKRITYGVDKKNTGTIEVSNQDITLSSSDLGSLLSRMSQLADLIDQKNALYERAKAISSDNTISADRLNGRIDVLKTRILSSVSNWETDDHGNIVFLSSDGTSAMMMSGSGFMIANSKDDNNEWVWRTFGTGEGFTADEIIAGFISADRIEAGTISVDKLTPNAGTELDISGNNTITTMIELIPGQISSYVDSALGAYSTTEQTADQISSYVNNALGAYSTSEQTADQISSYVNNALGAYSTTEQTADQISSYVNNALGSYSTSTQTAEMINLAVGNKYTVVSGIDITTNGIDVHGAFYVRIRSGGTFDVDSENFKISSSLKYVQTDNMRLDGTGITYTDSNGRKVAFGNYVQNKVNVMAGFFGYLNDGEARGVAQIYASPYNHGDSATLDIACVDRGDGEYVNVTYPQSSTFCILGLPNAMYSYIYAQNIIGRKAIFNTTYESSTISFILDGSYNASHFITENPRMYLKMRYVHDYQSYPDIDISTMNSVAVNFMCPVKGRSATFNTIAQTSSRSIKHDIEPMASVGETLDQLQPVTFIYDNDPDEKTRMGLIYEDTIEVMPEICVSENSNKAISYVDLVPALLKEIQDLRARVADLEQ